MGLIVVVEANWLVVISTRAYYGESTFRLLACRQKAECRIRCWDCPCFTIESWYNIGTCFARRYAKALKQVGHGFSVTIIKERTVVLKHNVLLRERNVVHCPVARGFPPFKEAPRHHQTPALCTEWMWPWTGDTTHVEPKWTGTTPQLGRRVRSSDNLAPYSQLGCRHQQRRLHLYVRNRGVVQKAMFGHNDSTPGNICHVTSTSAYEVTK